MENQQPSPKGKVQRLSNTIINVTHNENKTEMYEVSRVVEIRSGRATYK